MKIHHLISIKIKDNEVFFIVDELKFQNKDISYWDKVINDLEDYAEVSISQQKDWDKIGIIFGWNEFNNL